MTNRKKKPNFDWNDAKGDVKIEKIANIDWNDKKDDITIKIFKKTQD